MKKQNCILVLLFIWSFSGVCFAQNKTKLDSLKVLLLLTKEDTISMRLHIEIGDFYGDANPDSAIVWFQKTPMPPDAKSNEEIYYSAIALLKTGRLLYLFEQDYTKSVDNLERSISLFKKIFKKNDNPFTAKSKLGLSKCLNNMGNVYSSQGDYPKATEYYLNSLRIAEDLEDKLQISKCYNNIGIVYADQGDYPKALEYYKKALQLNEEFGDNNGSSTSMINIGVVYFNQGDYPKATEFYQKALKIAEELGDNTGISACLINLGLVNHEQGDYSKAMDYYKSSLQLYEQVGDKTGISYCLNNLGSVYSYQDNYAKAEEYGKMSLIIAEELGNKPQISTCLIGFGNVYSNQGNYTKAIEYFQKALQLAEELNDRKQISACLNNLACAYKNQSNDDKIPQTEKNALLQTAVEYYQKSLLIEEELGMFADLTIDYWTLANAFVKQNHPEKAANLYLKANRMNRKLIQDNFSILSEKEKAEFLETSGGSFNTLDEFALMTKADSIIAQCYNNELMLKGIVLQSSRAILDAANNSADTAMSDTYWKFKMYRNKITELNSTPIADRQQDIKTIEALATEQEQKLVLLSKDYAEMKKQFNYQWEDVQKNLKKGEAAIEFVRISCHLSYNNDLLSVDTILNYLNKCDSIVYKKETRDSVVYAALILRQGFNRPEMISLFDEKDLQKIMQREEHISDVKYVSSLYSPANRKEIIDTSAIPTGKYKGEELYKLIWLPMEKYLKGAKTLYFSPAGLLNKISFVAIPISKDSLLSDKYKLNAVSSTREVIRKQENNRLLKSATAAVYGGIIYDLKIEQLRTIASKQQTNIEYPDRAESTNGSWDYLLGTYNEAKAVNDLFAKNKISSTLVTGSGATEESFKHFGDSISPTIIHVSTHGFFSAEPDAEISYQTQNIFKIAKDPLWRSGLLLAGANYIWQTNERIAKLEDGVLTAWEISNLNLSNTRLAVLSACETGLGDVKGSEGVFGLQRGFKMAGVDYIIMSLWQVPDEQTVELMTKFYNNCFSGMSIRDAFQSAQTELRKKYAPYYWAAFVLME